MNKKIISIAIALVLVLLTGALGFVSGGFRNWDTATWFEKKQEQDENGTLAVDADGNGLTNGKEYSLPSQMTFINTMSAAEVITLTAEIYPENATIKDVEWDVHWACDYYNTEPHNPDWWYDRNISDFVSVVPSAENSLIADVTCLDAFGEQVIIEVKSVSNPDVKVVCEVDFAARIENIDYVVKEYISFDPKVYSNTWNIENDGFPLIAGFPFLEGEEFLRGSLDPFFDVVWSPHTIAGSLTTHDLGPWFDLPEHEITFSYLNGFLTDFNAMGIPGLTLNQVSFTRETFAYQHGVGIEYLCNQFFGNLSNNPNFSVLVNFLNDYEGDILKIEVSQKYTSGGIDREYQQVMTSKIDAERLYLSVEGLELNQNAIIF